eukprot:CCRYP_003741-RA/>CCRYP_003741-RA protein AED:0.46 eAED:0.46 QI:0/0/0/0.66/0.5/0.33/3/0/204
MYDYRDLKRQYGRKSVIPSMAMTPAALTSKVNRQGECKVDAPVAGGSWAKENTLTEIDTKFMSHAQPSTPQLLSSSNSVTYFKSINRGQKGKKSRTTLAPLFKKRLTLKVLGLKNLPVCNYGLKYSTREAQPRGDEAKRLASQDLLIFKSPLMPTIIERIDTKSFEAITRSASSLEGKFNNKLQVDVDNPHTTQATSKDEAEKM